MRQRLLPCSGMYTPVKPWSGPAQTGCSNSLMIMSKRHKNTPGKCKPAGGKIMPKNRFLILLWVKWWVKRNFYKPKTRISYADTRVFVGGVREIWTLAALSDPTPLAGAPLRPLEYYSTSQSDKLFTFSHKMAERMGFEPMVRSRESLVFKTSSLNHSDTSPQWPPPRCDSYITISPAECQAWKWKNSKRNCKN